MERFCIIYHSALLTICLFACVNPVVGQSIRVNAVVDGERVVLSNGKRIKLAGVDAPEYHASMQLSKEALLTGRTEEAVKRQGEIAFAYLRMLAMDQRVQVQYEPAANHSVDTYILAYLHVLDQRGRIAYTLNSRMIDDGYASVDTADGVAMADTYSILEAEARKQGKGLWAENSPYSFSTPGERHPSSGASLQSSCAVDAACVWIGEGRSGMWKSRPGRKCPCVDT